MSSFGDLPQGSVSAGYQPGSMPSPGSDGVAQPRRSRLLVAAILALSLLVVAGVVVLLFVLGASRSHSEPSLANGLKVSLNKLVVIQVEGDDEGVTVSRPYSVFLPEDRLAVFAPVGEKVYFNVVRKATGGEVSPGESKVSWPVGSDGKGGSLPACGAGQRYALENDVMACADVAVPQAAGKDEGFGQVLYSGKDLKIIAAPSIDNAKALSGFSPEGKLLWSKELATPGQVSLDGSNIIVTSFEGSKVSIEGYGAVEESQKPTEPPTLVEAAKGPDKDAIKAFDYRNNFALGWVNPGNDDCAGYNDDGSPVFKKIPDENDGCWLTMVEGESQEVVDARYGETPWLLFDVSHSSLQPNYEDVNSDGFLDLLVKGFTPDWVEGFVYIFDPADPEHPYVAPVGFNWSAVSHPEYRGEGLFEVEESIESGDGEFEPCVMLRFRVENNTNGVPHVVDFEEIDYETAKEEGCL